MRQAYRILPVYAGDVSGVCSALFELGGMVVMHDPSGCNSTYNTHDEIRWYDHDALIFLSGLNDVDAIMGNDEKLIDDIVQAAELCHPAFIAIANSPVPWQMGTDFEAITALVQERSGIPSFYVPTNGMHDGFRGAALALEALGRQEVREREKRETAAGGVAGSTGRAGESAEVKERDGQERGTGINLLGLLPLAYPDPASVGTIRRQAEAAGFPVVSDWAMEEPGEYDTSDGFSGELLPGIRRAAEAKASLVLSTAGILAARDLQRRFGIPFVCGMPCGAFAGHLWRALREGRPGAAYLPIVEAAEGRDEETVCLIGEPVVMGSLAADLALAGERVHLICPTECEEGLVPAGADITRGEEEVIAAAAPYRRFVCDPMYAEVLPQGSRVFPLADLAFSGRIYQEQFRDLCGVTAQEIVGRI